MVKVVVWTLPSINFLQGEHCVYNLKEEDFENDKESTEEYRFAIKKTVVNRFCMNPKENEIRVDNIKPENVVCILGVSPNFDITVACGLKFHWYLRTLSLKLQFCL